jgi:hypothetical protein
MKHFLGILLCVVVLSACHSASFEPPTQVPEQKNFPTTTQSPTAHLTETPVPPSPTITVLLPTEAATTVPPTETPKPICVTLNYGEYAQFEIISSSGQRVMVDVYDPEKLSRPVEASDVLLTTHTHWDHLNEDFLANFPGLQLFVEIGMLEAPGAIVQGIASAHNHGDAFKNEGGTNYVYLVEIGGLRIAHFGDIGQEKLTAEQLVVLGQVDIAITQLNNPYSDMNAENRKGINLMDQVQPRLIIPTHINLDAAKQAVAQWPGLYSETPSVVICEADLSEYGTQILFMGETAETMVKYMDLIEW